MKILHLINSLEIGGAEKLIVDSVPLYNIKRIQTEILILNVNKTSFYDNLIKYNNL